MWKNPSLLSEIRNILREDPTFCDDPTIYDEPTSCDDLTICDDPTISDDLTRHGKSG